MKRRIDWRRDDGMTLAELVVGMAVMAIFLAMFTTVVLSMGNASAHVAAIANSTSDTNTAFLRLDKTIRYASAISEPSATPTPAGNWYAEYQTTNTGATVCTQLRLDDTAKTLSWRTWTVQPDGTYTALTPFAVIASGVGSSGTPFDLVEAVSPTVGFEQLGVSLSSTEKVGSQPSTTSTKLTFTAMNSANASDKATSTPGWSSSVCTGPGRP